MVNRAVACWTVALLAVATGCSDERNAYEPDCLRALTELAGRDPERIPMRVRQVLNGDRVTLRLQQETSDLFSGTVNSSTGTAQISFLKGTECLPLGVVPSDVPPSIGIG